MKQTIIHEKLGEIIYDENFWTGRKSLTVNKVPLTRISKKEFQMPDGSTGMVKGSFLYGASLETCGESIRIMPKIKWYEVVLAVMPFILIMIWSNVIPLCLIVPVVGGLIGGGISGLLSVTGLLCMRSVKPVWLKILIGIAAIGVTFGVCCGIGYAILGALT